jgi:hypothetical protein
MIFRLVLVIIIPVVHLSGSRSAQINPERSSNWGRGSGNRNRVFLPALIFPSCCSILSIFFCRSPRVLVWLVRYLPCTRLSILGRNPSWSELHFATVREKWPTKTHLRWKRKETGQHFRVGVPDPSPPNLTPPIGGWKARR